MYRQFPNHPTWIGEFNSQPKDWRNWHSIARRVTRRPKIPEESLFTMREDYRVLRVWGVEVDRLKSIRYARGHMRGRQGNYTFATLSKDITIHLQVPPSSRFDDAVFLLDGASVPFILRQEEHLATGTVTRWQMIGAARGADVRGIDMGRWQDVRQHVAPGLLV